MIDMFCEMHNTSSFQIPISKYAFFKFFYIHFSNNNKSAIKETYFKSKRAPLTNFSILFIFF